MGRTKAGQMPKSCSGEKEFRIARCKVGSTWSCPVAATENPIFEQLGSETKVVLNAIKDIFEDKYGKSDYIIAEEMHENGKRHYHAYFKFYEKLDIKDASAFDLCGVHPNILNPGKGWPGYCAKDKQYITNFYEAEPFSEASKMDCVEDAVKYLWSKRPREMCIHGANIEYNLRKQLGSNEFKKIGYEPEWKSWEALWPWQSKTWAYVQEAPKPRRIFLIGPGKHVGKSQFVVYLQANYEYGVYDLGTSSWKKDDVLARYKGEGVVIIDIPYEFDWEKMSPHVNSLLEMFSNTGQTVDFKKYKGGKAVLACHVLVFSNRPASEWRGLEHKELVHINAARPENLKEFDDSVQIVQTKRRRIEEPEPEGSLADSFAYA